MKWVHWNPSFYPINQKVYIVRAPPQHRSARQKIHKLHLGYTALHKSHNVLNKLNIMKPDTSDIQWKKCNITLIKLVTEKRPWNKGWHTQKPEKKWDRQRGMRHIVKQQELVNVTIQEHQEMPHLLTITSWKKKTKQNKFPMHVCLASPITHFNHLLNRREQNDLWHLVRWVIAQRMQSLQGYFVAALLMTWTTDALSQMKVRDVPCTLMWCFFHSGGHIPCTQRVPKMNCTHPIRGIREKL